LKGVKVRKKRLTFFTLGSDAFLRDIIISLRKDYDIKFFCRGDGQEFHQLMHDTDIAWIEWCDQLAEQATVQPKRCPTICRLHSYEMFTPMPGKVDWNKIDKLVFVSDVVRDYTLKKFGIRPDIVETIYNGVDVDRFVIPKNKKYNKKIAFIGYLNYKKGPELLLQTWKKIYDYDPSFEFHVAGEHQDERIHLYFNTIASKLPFKIYMDGWIKDVSKYMEDKDYIISTSLFESFQFGLAEGMAQGCVPLVHCWTGSDLIYPKKYIFTFPEECVNIIKDFESIDNKEGEREILRQHIVDRYSLKDQIEKTRELIESF
jgi:glycosyltransferase involved in cell wall biosynthesis